MNQAQMSQPSLPLQPIHTGDAISWWPPAPGWIVLFIITLIALIWLSIKLIARYQLNKPKRQVLHHLKQLKKEYSQQHKVDEPNSGAQLLQSSSALLKRFLLATHPRASVAKLTGQALQDFLAEHCQDHALKKKLLSDKGRLLSHDRYQAGPHPTHNKNLTQSASEQEPARKEPLQQEQLKKNLELLDLIIDWVQQFPLTGKQRNQMEAPHARV